MREEIQVFEKKWRQYDKWFEKNKEIYLSEIEALKRIVPKGFGLEIGVGTGRFAQPLGVEIGLDPSLNMLKIARERGMKVIQGLGELLPFKNESFEVATIIVTLCFVKEPLKVLREAKRILKKKGVLILGVINKDSKWGIFYETKKRKSKFYKVANFYSAQQVLQLASEAGLRFCGAYQTLFQGPDDFEEIEKPKKGFKEGGFIALEFTKNNRQRINFFNKSKKEEFYV